MELFLRQSEAWKFAETIDDPKRRLLTEIAIGRALSFLAADPDYARSFADNPLDVLVFARAVHSLFVEEATVRGVLDGKITSIDDLNPFPPVE